MAFLPLFFLTADTFFYFFAKQRATEKQLEFVSVFERFIAALCLNFKSRCHHIKECDIYTAQVVFLGFFSRSRSLRISN